MVLINSVLTCVYLTQTTATNVSFKMEREREREREKGGGLVDYIILSRVWYHQRSWFQ